MSVTSNYQVLCFSLSKCIPITRLRINRSMDGSHSKINPCNLPVIIYASTVTVSVAVWLRRSVLCFQAATQSVLCENSRPPALEWRGGIEASSAQFCVLSARQVALGGVTTARGDVWLHLPLPFVPPPAIRALSALSK